jgi:hypothetical protein
VRAKARKPRKQWRRKPPFSAPPPAPIEDLTKADVALLAAMADPDRFRATNEELWTAAGISRATFYRLTRDPGFAARRRQQLFDVLRSEVNDVVYATLLNAQLPGREGFADRKLLLEMTGVYQPSATKLEIKGPPAIEGDMPDAELVYMYLTAHWPRANWLPGVRTRYEQGQIEPRPPAATPGTRPTTGETV